MNYSLVVKSPGGGGPRAYHCHLGGDTTNGCGQNFCMKTLPVVSTLYALYVGRIFPPRLQKEDPHKLCSERAWHHAKTSK